VIFESLELTSVFSPYFIVEDDSELKPAPPLFFSVSTAKAMEMIQENRKTGFNMVQWSQDVN